MNNISITVPSFSTAFGCPVHNLREAIQEIAKVLAAKQTGETSQAAYAAAGSLNELIAKLREMGA